MKSTSTERTVRLNLISLRHENSVHTQSYRILVHVYVFRSHLRHDGYCKRFVRRREYISHNVSAFRIAEIQRQIAVYRGIGFLALIFSIATAGPCTCDITYRDITCMPVLQSELSDTWSDNLAHCDTYVSHTVKYQRSR